MPLITTIISPWVMLRRFLFRALNRLLWRLPGRPFWRLLNRLGRAGIPQPPSPIIGAGGIDVEGYRAGYELSLSDLD